MASRRPPLFELLQHEDGPRKGPGSGVGRPNALGHAPDGSAAPKATNGQAQGAVETKPSNGQGEPVAKTTLEDLAEPATKPQPKPQAKPRTTHVPAPTPEPAPKPKAADPKPAPRPERAAGAADWSGMHPKSAVSVRMMWVYGTIVAVLVVVVCVWILGYNLGVSSKEAELRPYLDRTSQPGTISDPMTASAGEQASDPLPLSGIERPEERRQAEQPPRIDPRPPVVEPKPVQTIDVLVDVREAGNNYMKWASGMTRERAVGLAEHLSTNGVHAMAIDEGRRGFGLYTALAVPSGQFSAMESQRRDLEARVIRLLGSAPQEAGGAYNPRDQIWMRFDG